MHRRIMSAVARTLRPEPTDQPTVHFHSDGPAGQPAPCFDSRCPRPQLELP